MHIIQGSDAHRLNRDPNRPSNLGVCDRMTEVQLEEASFAALRDLFESDHFNRIRPYRPSHDPYDFVRIARAEGETIVQAFHETLPPRRGRLSPVVRDAAAFANGNGGTIFVGISANPRDAVAGVENAPETARAIAEDLARYVTPPIAGTIDISATENRQLIVIQVPAGSDKPYAVLPSTIYVRQEGETTIAVRDEIVQLVKAGVAETSGSLPELVPTTERVAPIAQQHRSVVLPDMDDSVLDVPGEEVQTAVTADGNGLRERSGSRSSRRRRSSSRSHSTEQPSVDAVAAAAPATFEVEGDGTIQLSEADVQQLHACDDIPFPRTGVEIVESAMLDGVRYHAMRDLRNLKIVQNVTRDSARRLWRYAITQLEMHPCRVEDVTWDTVSDRGYWKSYKPRGGDVRYNLVYRHDDHLHVFYGVTDEGIDDDWRNVLPAHLAERHNANGASDPSDEQTPVSDNTPDVVVEEQPRAFVPFGVVPDPEPTPDVSAAVVTVPEVLEETTAEVPTPEPEPVAATEPPAPTRTRRPRSRKPKVAETDAVQPESMVTESAELQAPEVAPMVEAVAAEEHAVAEQPAEEAPAKPKRTRRPATPRKKKSDAEQSAEAAAAEPESTQPEVAAEQPVEEAPAKPKRTRRTTTPRKKKTETSETGETSDDPPSEQDGD